MSVLEGDLEVIALPDVFRLLAANKVTGALRVARDSGDGVIYFRDGEVYFGFSSLTREFLGQRLVNAKLITQGQLLRILDEQKKAGDKRLGDLLIEKGYLSKDLLGTFIKEQIQDAIFHLLQWDRGGFTFELREESPQEIGLSVSVENLIMESSRRIEEWEVIQRKIPSLDVVVQMAPTPPDETVEVNIKPEEWTLLVLADGNRTVRDIAAAAERSDFETCRILYGLVTAGLLDVGRGTSSAQISAVARVKLEPAAEPEPVVAQQESAVEPQQPPAEGTWQGQAEAELQAAEPEPELQITEPETELQITEPEPELQITEPEPEVRMEVLTDEPIWPGETFEPAQQAEVPEGSTAQLPPEVEADYVEVEQLPQEEPEYVTEASVAETTSDVQDGTDWAAFYPPEEPAEVVSASIEESGNGAPSPGKQPVPATKASDQGVSKETLMRLIAGVRNL